MSGAVLEREEIVAGVVAAAGGRLVGRIRLQKIIYLLDRLGLHSGFTYEYHHFGPFSRELDSATADAKAFLGLREDFAHRSVDGARYSIFNFDGEIGESVFNSIGHETACAFVKTFVSTNVTVLELAATADWIWQTEGITDWKNELLKRKGQKLQNGRFERALELLKKLSLSPPDSWIQAHSSTV